MKYLGNRLGRLEKTKQEISGIRYKEKEIDTYFFYWVV